MDTKNITTIEEGFNELQNYSDNQFKAIVELQKQIATLQAENQSLKTMLEQNLPSLNNDLSFQISNEELICLTQLQMLKDAAVMSPLTLEETRKFQVFSDVLTRIKAKSPSSQETTVKNMSTEQLLTIVQSNG